MRGKRTLRACLWEVVVDASKPQNKYGAIPLGLV
jgi:hypothetical protein